jgi:acyl-CoA synthetase (AMP-forming)/AMP-acid ligase II
MLEFLNNGRASSPAFVDVPQNQTVSYGDLRSKVEEIKSWLRSQRDSLLAFLYSTNTVDSISVYLACLDQNVPICLLEPKDSNLRGLTGIYIPDMLLLPAGIVPPEGYADAGLVSGTSYQSYRPAVPSLVYRNYHPDLSVLLPTSGSTGNPKLVRLKKSNVLANARSIVKYLGINEQERSIQGLPMYYSYGLSLLNTHLLAGATTVLTKHSFMMGEFWQDFDAQRCTSFAGVPYMYETLHRLEFDPKKRPTLATMTQAGGGLRPDLIAAFHEKVKAAGKRFFVMYGQTEATARISYVPWERLGEKIGSIGIPIPDGQMTLRPVEGMPDVEELVYTGPNVMMGYAEDREALTQGDLLGGVLYTGDLARSDDDGFFYLVGRLKRFAKLYGKRVNLADIESSVEKTFPVHSAALEGKNKIRLFVALREKIDLELIRRHTAEFLGVTLASIEVNVVDAIPVTPSGKKDYKPLE